MADPDLSVVTVSFNTREVLGDSLEAVQRYRGRLQVEQWVIDNGSTDGSAEMVRRRHPAVNLIVSKENLGPGRARNLAIPRCSGRYLLNIDSDVMVHPGTMERLVDYMDQHPDVAALGCKLLNPDGSYQATTRHLRQVTPALKRKIRAVLTRRRDDPDSGASAARNVGWLVGALCLYRKTALSESGLFDPRFYIYRDDLDLHTRLHHKGWKVAFLPTATATHYLGKTADGNYAVARYDAEYGELLFTRKYGPLWWYGYSRIALLVKAFYFARLCSDDKLRRRFWGKNPQVLRQVYAELARASLPFPGRHLAASSAPPAGAAWASAGLTTPRASAPMSGSPAG
ncbi:MAG TPA: glycosyltransferase family 2 protein [Candidatus Dormibacteraeota bacterium]|nr:glycosyltransferase family 2 protein [Candidatus Dormibacteraeota bacterium]